MRTIAACLLCALTYAQSPTTADGLSAIEARVLALVPRLRAATVAIRDAGGQGSGVIVTEDGYVLTAAHVFDEPGAKVAITLHDGRRVEGLTRGRQRRSDFGLVEITADGPWPFVEMGTTEGLELEDYCIATGHPGGYERERPPPVRVGRITRLRGPFLRSSAVIDQGDSGGPLFDLDGKVIGIHSRIQLLPGSNYHVAVDHFRDNWQRLVAGRTWSGRTPRFDRGRPVLGIRGADGTDGCRVLDVYPDTPAEAAGLRVDDVIVRADGEPIEGRDGLADIVGQRSARDEIDFEVRRGEESVQLHVTLGAAAADGTPATTRVEELVGEESDLDDALAALVATHRGSVVTVTSGLDDRVLGCVASADGLVLTKASELHGSPQCRLADGRVLPATLVATDAATDLALLRVEAQELVPVEWSRDDGLGAGRWLVSVGPEAEPLALGVVGVAPRRIPSESAYLGVSLTDAAKGGGARIERVHADTAAERAGLVAGDVVVGFGGHEVSDRETLIRSIRTREPGDAVALAVEREGAVVELTLELGRRDVEALARGRRRMRAAFSARRHGFARALQHDGVITRRECGGPVLDAGGRAVALNIARASRTQTLALPADAVLAALGRLLPTVPTKDR